MKKIFEHLILAVLVIMFWSIPFVALFACEYGLIGLTLFAASGYVFVKFANSKKIEELIKKYE